MKYVLACSLCGTTFAYWGCSLGWLGIPLVWLALSFFALAAGQESD